MNPRPSRKSDDSFSSHWVLRTAGVCVGLLGLIAMLAWHTHWIGYFRLLPGGVVMKYNTALCFVLSGFGAATLTSKYSRLAPAMGVVAGSIALATLCEYVLGARWPLDEFFIRDYLLEGTIDPGRMAPLTAACFTLLAIALVSSGGFAPARRRILLASLSTASVMLITGATLIAHLLGINVAFGWGVYTRMAVETGAAFFVLSVGMFIWSWHAGRSRGIDLIRWLPTTASVTIMGVVALGSSLGQAQLENAVNWGRHTYEVLLTSQSLLTQLQDVQRGVRRYALLDQREALEAFRSAEAQVPRTLADLELLTRDNPLQHGRISTLTIDARQVHDYAERLIAVHDAAGKDAAAKFDNAGEGRTIADRARTDLQAFANTERGLLTERNGISERNFRSTERLTIAASVLAAILVAFALFLSDRELVRRRQADARLADSLQLQSEILNSAHYAIISSDRDGVITSFNAAAERMLGYKGSEVIGRATPALWHDPAELEARAIEVAARLGRPVPPNAFISNARPGIPDEKEWTYKRKNGTRFQGSLVVTALTRADGTVSGYLGIMADVTERIEQQAELRRSEDRFRRAFDHAPIGMALVSPDGRWLKVNQALCEFLGYSADQLLRSDLAAIKHPDDRGDTARHFKEALSSELTSAPVEKRYIHRDGHEIFARLSFSLARDETGAPLYFITQLEDVTQRRQMERLKSEFVATVSHELRTPLTSIRGSLGLLAGGVLGPLSDKAAPMVKIALQNSERLIRIINDILDVEKIEAGKLELHCERLALAAALEQAIQVNQAYADKYQVRLTLEPVTADEAVLADPGRLMQVMANLLSNAAKFSPAGSTVAVRANRRGNSMRIEVEDHGTGIPEEFRARMFEKFAQADGSSSRRFDGTGLGLNITRQLVEAMRGRIGFESATGVGTTFHIELPLAFAEQDEKAQPTLSDTAAWRVLLCEEAARNSPLHNNKPRVLHVEDDIDLWRVLQTALEGRAEIVTAATLDEARTRLESDSFSLVLLDLTLPDGDGLTLLDQWPLEGHRSSTPVVILSASEVPQEVARRATAALVKSRVSESVVIETILSVIRDESAVRSETERSEAVSSTAV